MNAAIPAVIAALGLNEAACLDAIEGADAYANNACLPLYSELLLSAPPVVAVEARSVFGNTLIYPANKAAQYLAAIAGKKTLSRADLDNAIAMGLKVVEVSAAKILCARDRFIGSRMMEIMRDEGLGAVPAYTRAVDELEGRA